MGDAYESQNPEDLRKLFIEFAAVSKQVASSADTHMCCKLATVLGEFLKRNMVWCFESAQWGRYGFLTNPTAPAS